MRSALVACAFHPGWRPGYRSEADAIAPALRRDATPQSHFLLAAALVGHLGSVGLEAEPRIEVARWVVLGQRPQRHRAPAVCAEVREGDIHQPLARRPPA